MVTTGVAGDEGQRSLGKLWQSTQTQIVVKGPS